MADTKKSYIDARLTRKSLEDLAKFRDEWGKASEEINRALTDMRKLQGLTKLLRRNAVFNQGVGQYTSGLETRASTGVQRTGLLGTRPGRQAEELKTLEQHEKRVSRYQEQRLRRQDALALNLQKQRTNVSKIVDLERLQNLQKKTQLRLEIEIGRQNQIGINNARTLRKEIDGRISSLKREQQALRQNLQYRSEQARLASRDRLFGDGGANLFAIQGGLLANYSILNAATGGGAFAARFTTELDEAMRNLQAIVRITDTDLQALEQSLVRTSESTKFTAVEIANAAVTLGQAGFSVTEIQNSISAVGLLATATGTELDRAVDIATSTLGVFNMEASQMANVANVMTEAVNTSKLNIEKLTLGLQYSGNIAAQSGVRFEELTAALGAMANAGIRSGSTLGTGMRQILIALQKPSKEFSATLDRLGLTMDDVDIQSRGLYGALKALQDSGFTAGDAIRSFEVRAAAAYNALANNLDQMLDLEDAFQETTASIQANETQMRSLTNQGRRLISVLGSVFATGLEPLKDGLILTTRGMGDFLSKLREAPQILKAVISGVTTLGAVLVTWRLGVLAVGIGKIVLGLKLFRGVIGPLGRGLVSLKLVFGSLIAGSIGLKGALLGVYAALGPVGVIIAAISAAAAAYTLFGNKVETAAKKLEKARTNFDNTSGSAEATAQTIKAVDGQLGELISRYGELQRDQSLLRQAISNVRRQFTNLGKDASGVGGSVDELVSSLQELRAELAEEYVIKLGAAQEDLEALRTIAITNNRAATERFLNDSGIGPSNPNPRLTLSEDTRAFRQLKDSFPAIFSKTEDKFAIRSDTRRAQVQLTELEALIDREGRSGSRNEKAQIRRLEQIIAEGERRNKALTEINRLDVETRKLIEANKKGNDLASSRVTGVLDASTQLARNGSRPVSQLLKGRDVSAGTAAELAGQERQKIQGQIDALRFEAEALAAQGYIQSEEILGNILTSLSKATGELDAYMMSLDEAMSSAQEETQGALLAGIQQQLQGAENTFREANNPQAILAATEQRLGLIDEYGKSRKIQIEASDQDSDTKGVLLQNLERELIALRKGVRREASGAIKEIGEDAADAITTVLESYTGNISRLRAIASERRELQRIQREAALSGNSATLSLATEALKALEEQETELRDIDGRLNTLKDTSLDLGTKLNSLGFDENMETRDALQSMIDKLQEAIEKGDELSEIELSSLERGFSRVGRLVERVFEPFREQVGASSRGILDLVAQVEGTAIGSNPRARGYNTTLDFGRWTGGQRNLTGMTLNEILELQGQMLANPENRALYGNGQGSSALGRYQIVRRTLRGLMRNLSLEGTELFTPQLQDRLAMQLIREAGNDPAAIARIWQGFETRGTPMSVISSALGNTNVPDRDAQSETYRLGENQRLMSSLTGATARANLDLEQNVSSVSDAIRQLNQVRSEAQAALTERGMQLDALLAKTTRTREEEEEINRLTQEKVGLNEFIVGTEERIRELKGVQGFFSLDLVKSARDWANENVNINRLLDDGLLSTLGSIRSGFSSLFQELSTEPQKAGQAFRQFGLSVAQSMQRAITEMLAVYAMQKLIGVVFPNASPAAGSFASIARTSVGLPIKAAHGREIPGGNMGVRDRVPVLAMPGEYLLRRSAAQMIGKENLDRLNSLGNRRMAHGGDIGMPNLGGFGGPQNIYLVDDRSKIPALGPNDVVSILSDDMARGGQTAQVVRAIQSGAL